MGKLDVKAFGLACGVLWGGCVVFMGIVNMFSTWCDAWVRLMASIYIGYTPTVLGSVIGGLWGFADAGIGGLILAWLYNKFLKAK